MSVADVIGSQTGLTVISAVIGAVWTAFKSSEWRENARTRRYAKAVEALEAGVEQTYRTYVQAIKAAREDGKLTEEERKQARELARDAAIEFGRTQGVDVLREVGAEYVDVWIAKLVQRLKNG